VVAKSGITEHGVNEMMGRIAATAGWLSGKPAVEVENIQKIVGSHAWDEVTKAVEQRYETGALFQSYGFEPLGRTFIHLFTDLMIAPYGAMREKGGSITATGKSKFRSKDGQPQLMFKIGESWIRTAKTIHQKGDHWIRDAIRRTIHDEHGYSGRRLSTDLGVSLTKMLKLKGGKA